MSDSRGVSALSVALCVVTLVVVGGYRTLEWWVFGTMSLMTLVAIACILHMYSEDKNGPKRDG